MHEYAFDVKLFAVVRLNAPNLDAARRALADVLDAAEPSDGFCAGYNSVAGAGVDGVTITECSLSPDDGNEPWCIEPFEIDGEEPEPYFDPENIYNSPGIRQSIEEDRK